MPGIYLKSIVEQNSDKLITREVKVDPIESLGSRAKKLVQRAADDSFRCTVCRYGRDRTKRRPQRHRRHCVDNSNRLQPLSTNTIDRFQSLDRFRKAQDFVGMTPGVVQIGRKNTPERL